MRDSCVRVNPTKDIALHRLNNQCQRFLSQEEAVRLFEAVRQSNNPVLSSIEAMLLLTGARKREEIDARWSCIDWERRIWRIAISKSGKSRYVQLSDGALLLLRLRRFEVGDQCPSIFPNPKSCAPYKCINNSWDTARRRAGMPELRLHDLRHSFASFWISSGRSLYEVQKNLGHSSAKMTEPYAHLAHDTLLPASNAVTLALGPCIDTTLVASASNSD
ncbi:site-specific integrase [Synechococcus sp. CB0205]|uniref:site-specific integrase n=1 Tax=Synechococcus sp. CB0205 TaxID=232363 RepID=UPI0002001E38|nr:site-specific integrase [Synechococcus sp. CB0205]